MYEPQTLIDCFLLVFLIMSGICFGIALPITIFGLLSDIWGIVKRDKFNIPFETKQDKE